jgi:single-stranded DNA-binding protein
VGFYALSIMVLLMGRLTLDPEMRWLASGKNVTTFI